MLILLSGNLRKSSVSDFKLNNSLLLSPENLFEVFILMRLNAT